MASYLLSVKQTPNINKGKDKIMARIAGVNIPENKHVEISLTHVLVLAELQHKHMHRSKDRYYKKVSDLTEDEVELIRG